MTTQEKMFHKVSKELGIPIKVLEPVFVSQFKLVVDAMAKGEAKAVRLPVFGTFRVKPKAKENLENKLKKFSDERKASGHTEEEI